MLHIMITFLSLHLPSWQGSTNVAVLAARPCVSGFWVQLDLETLFMYSSYRPSKYFAFFFSRLNQFQHALSPHIIVIMALIVVINAVFIDPGAHVI